MKHYRRWKNNTFASNCHNIMKIATLLKKIYLSFFRKVIINIEGLRIDPNNYIFVEQPKTGQSNNKIIDRVLHVKKARLFYCQIMRYPIIIYFVTSYCTKQFLKIPITIELLYLNALVNHSVYKTFINNDFTVYVFLVEDN